MHKQGCMAEGRGSNGELLIDWQEQREQEVKGNQQNEKAVMTGGGGKPEERWSAAV